MLFTIILFFLGLAVACALIVRKAWQIRSGKVVPGSYEEGDWHHLSIESVRTRLVEVVKFGVHHFVLFALKVWILLSGSFRKADAQVKVKLTHVLRKNGHLPARGKPSGFLKNIRAHKDKVATAMESEGSEEIAQNEKI